MHESLIKKLCFEIGEQYELNEFNLKYVSSTLENNLRLENYEFLQVKSFCLFGIELTRPVSLYYNADILFKIVYHFPREKLSEFVSTLQKYLQIDNSVIHIELKNGRIITLKDSTKISLKIFVEEDVKFTVVKV